MKWKFSIISALTMFLVPLILTNFPIVPALIFLKIIYIIPFGIIGEHIFILPSNSFVPIGLGGFPTHWGIISVISYILWVIIGIIWGLILYRIRKTKSESPRFGFGAFVSTFIVQLGIGTLLLLIARVV